MKTKLLLPAFLFILSTLLVSSCNKNEEEPHAPVSPPSSTQEKLLASQSNNFGFEMFQELRQANPDDNLLISPLSISMALGMTMNGAAGNTYESMRSTLGFGDLNQTAINEGYQHLRNYLPVADPNTETNISNSIWNKNTFTPLPGFIETNQGYFNAAVESLDFDDDASIDVINNWVSDATNHNIEEIIEFIDPDAVMFLINAIYFNAPWAFPFNPEKTVLAGFLKSDGTYIQTPTMISENMPFGYFSNDHVQVVNLPYGNEQYHFTAVIPKYNSSIDALASSINSTDFDDWIKNLTYNHQLKLYMPRFEFDYGSDLVSSLENMGMHSIRIGADFSGIHPVIPLALNRVIHKTYITVTEDGTEAAAVTAVEVTVTGEVPQVNIAQPFIFFIREAETGAILFMGQLMDPT